MTENISIVLAHPLPFGGRDRLPASWAVKAVEAPAGDRYTRALREALPGARGLISFLTDQVDREVIEAGPELEIIANAGVGFNNIDWQFARQRGIAVTNTPGVLTAATADLTMALLLACARRLGEAERFLREGRFQGIDLELMLGLELNGATLGIIGLGRIGQAVAVRARAFGMNILYVNRRALPEEREIELKARRVSLDELLAESDVVSLHCPLTPDTRHLLDEEALRRMKPGAILINTARGAVVDETALVRVLESGHLGGAGLDVYEREPEIHPGLLTLPRVTLLPHIGSATTVTRRAIVNMAVDNLIAYFRTGKPLNPVY